MKKILGIGNALLDIITFLEDDDLLQSLSLPKGSMQLVDAVTSLRINTLTTDLKKHSASGGSAANTIHGLANLGVPTGFIGTVGPDDMGIFFKKDMQDSGITTFLVIGEQQTGQAISLVSRDGERTFATHLGAAVEINSKDLNQNVFKNFDHLHLEGYLLQNHDLINTAVKLAKENDMTMSIDLASYNVVEANLEFLRGIVSEFIDTVFANENEAHAFTSREDPEKALIDLASFCKTAVVKIGEKGSLIMQDDALCHVEAIDAKCLDTTGAGDLYASGFLYGMMKGFSTEACGKSGALLAGKVIEEPGAKIGKEGWMFVLHELAKIP